MEEREIITDIGVLKNDWVTRNRKFREWYDMLTLKDNLKQEGLESVCANDPRTLYNLGHYLMTAGELHHIIPVSVDSPIELEKQAKCERALEYLWRGVDRKMSKGGRQSFLSELNFFILALGWYAGVVSFDDTEQKGIAVLWNPADTYPRYSDNEMVTCLHEYKLPITSAVRKAKTNGWSYNPTRKTGDVVLSDYYYLDENGKFINSILIDNKTVMGETSRDDAMLMVSPVGGFPDKGSIVPGDIDWTTRIGQSILETNKDIYAKQNRWLTFELQILRDTAQSKYIEYSQGDPKVQAEQLTKRGALFHFLPGEDLKTLDPSPIPLEMQAAIAAFDKQTQKGGFGDVLYGLLEGNLSGFALSQAIETANRLLYNYQNAKNFFIAETDNFWLSKLQEKSKTFQIKGRTLEELSPKEIPEDVDVIVESELATPRDWLEKATVANYMKDMLDETLIMSDILKIKDTNAVKRRREMDRVEQHPQIQNVKLITYCTKHAEYLRYMGDNTQAAIWEQAAAGLQAQLGAPASGQGAPPTASAVEAARKAGAPERKPSVSPAVQPSQMRRISQERQKGE